ncbi:MAG: glycosyl transferase [Clostridiales bacterium]|jgi:UDP-N-acetylglucosamine transferase subunit ALG13|nr:glycosyl transferase [Clostridiales bacterium]
MIFVILGTQKFQLNRLLIEMDDLIETGGITQEVIAQIGVSDYEPKNYQFHRYIDKNQFDEYITQASLIITHSGVGSIITALKAKKPVVVYPRLRRYNEHVDDHQLDIAKAFEKMNYVLCRHKEDTLAEVMNRCKQYPFAEYVENTNRISGIINAFLHKEYNNTSI